MTSPHFVVKISLYVIYFFFCFVEYISMNIFVMFFYIYIYSLYFNYDTNFVNNITRMQSFVPLLLTQQSNFGQAYKKNTHRHVNQFRHWNFKKKSRVGHDHRAFLKDSYFYELYGCKCYLK